MKTTPPKQAAHSPLPWRIDYGEDVMRDKVAITTAPALPHHLAQHVADCGAVGNPLAIANAELILNRCNHFAALRASHEALVEACKRLARFTDALESEASAGDRAFKSEPLLQAEAALATATALQRKLNEH